MSTNTTVIPVAELRPGMVETSYPHPVRSVRPADHPTFGLAVVVVYEDGCGSTRPADVATAVHA